MLAREFKKYLELREEHEKLKAKMGEAQDYVIDLMREGKVKAMPGYGSLVESEVTELDEDGLIAALNKAQRMLVTRRVVDRKSLEAAVARGLIDPQVVVPFMNTKPRAAYIRIG